MIVSLLFFLPQVPCFHFSLALFLSLSLFRSLCESYFHIEQVCTVGFVDFATGRWNWRWPLSLVCWLQSRLHWPGTRSPARGPGIGRARGLGMSADPSGCRVECGSLKKQFSPGQGCVFIFDTLYFDVQWVIWSQYETLCNMGCMKLAISVCGVKGGVGWGCKTWNIEWEC